MCMLVGLLRTKLVMRAYISWSKSATIILHIIYYDYYKLCKQRVLHIDDHVFKRVLSEETVVFFFVDDVS